VSAPANTVLANRYRIVERLGGGGMGEVYRALDHVLEREVAIKVLTEGSDEFNRRFLVEAQSMARLNHPNIVAVYDVGVDREYSYIVLEYVRGRTLRELDHTALGIDGSIELAIQLLEALRYAHDRDVVHRDLKPGNVLVTADGTLKVMDFGLARRLSDVANLEQSGEIMGTIAYLSPERFLGKPGDRSSDLYAVGVLLYELLCGAPPFADPTADLAEVMRVRVSEPPHPLRELNPRIPPRLDDLVQRLLEIDPAKRPDDAGEVIAQLRAIRPSPAAGLREPPSARVPDDRQVRVARAIELMRQGRTDGLGGRSRKAIAHYRAALAALGGAARCAEDRPVRRAKH
jgi:eukaryotic-like serine/threonine-protein kinase